MELLPKFRRMQEYCYFSKKGSHHRRYPITFKNSCSLVTLAGNIFGEVIFQYSCREYIGHVELRKKILD